MSQGAGKTLVLLITSSLGGALLIGLAFRAGLGDSLWVNESVRSCIAVAGVVSALILVFLLVLLNRAKEGSAYTSVVACGLAAMCIPGVVRSVNPVSNTTLWMYNLSTFAGALIPTLLFLSRERAARLGHRWLFMISVAMLLMCVVLLVRKDALPAMVGRDGFTPVTRGIHFLSGVLFLAATLRLMQLWAREGLTDELFFSAQFLLLALSSLVYAFSDRWDAPWWTSHMLRLAASSVTLALILVLTTRVRRERDASREEAALAERQLRLALEAAPNPMILTSSKGRILHANARIHDLLGYDPGDLIGREVEELIPEGVRAAHVRMREAYLENPHPRPLGIGRDLTALTRDGQTVSVEIGLNPLNLRGETCVLGSIIDVSERKKLEQRYRAMLEHAPTALLMVDAAGTIVLASRETERLFGYAHAELHGRPIEALVPARLHAGHVKLRSEYLAHPEPVRIGQSRDLFGVRRDGSEFVVEIGLCPVTIPEGRFVLAAVVDITARKAAEAALARQATELLAHNETLAARNAELDEFTYVASHDLQEPLRKLISFSALLETDLGGNLPDRAKTDLHYITDAAERMRVLVQDLLTLSRAGRAAMRREPVRLDQCVDDALALMSERIRDLNAKIRRDPLPTVTGDRTLLTQLVQNLLTNAMKFVREDVPPEIGIAAQRDGDAWIVCVADNGIGIKPEHVAQIFVPFKRLNPRSQYPGSGIGLSICRKVVERHAGRIWVESEPGEGSRFSFSIPDVVEARQWTETVSSPRSSSSLRMTPAIRS
ncbi:MAG: Adaptive-response sensory-kinase SasA [Phycisphaerae bacterium]|nr:Adaptive-response sensory-kinase SasA [Phycisphaerae bacterium]